MANPDNSIIAQLQNLNTARELMPNLTDWGVKDFSCSIHSLGMTYLTLLGNHLGYVGVAEVPTPKNGQYAYIGDDIRSDSVWFNRETRLPTLIAEFERYSGVIDQSKLESKVKNLLLAHNRWDGKPEYLVLAYWTKGISSFPKYENLQQIISKGFKTPAQEPVEGTSRQKLLLLQFWMRENSDQKLYLSEIVVRGN
ncbi:hypothetical protein NIES4071_06700 [Calothrix sp. NIES-4071]|nr:hypothetical protein NIES4071_06700 [Calothrix sp. NIES-4071]BAZ55012.1 hypothetical protein NIES4105_06660 [Calothrix sp. NIES-4105]